jgi:predicted nucleic acid-binding Zn ribbon protein
LRELVADRGWERTLTVASVMGRWDTLVGPEIAAHCRPERLYDGVLHLVAESSAWATQLRLLAPRIIERLAAEVGGAGVTSIRVHGPAAPDWRHGPRRVAGGRGPRDTYG